MVTCSSILAWKNSMDKRSLAGYSPWGRKKLDMTEHMHTCTQTHTHTHTHRDSDRRGDQGWDRDVQQLGAQRVPTQEGVYRRDGSLGRG